MSALPSIYSDEGLSKSDRSKVLTVGKPRAGRPIGAVKLEERVHDAAVGNVVHQQTHNSKSSDTSIDDDGDIPMLGMDDEEEVQLVADYVMDNRLNTISRGREYQESILPTELTSNNIDDQDLTPRERLSKDTIMIIDTNFIISHLDIIDELAKLHIKYHHKIIIPSTVMLELDGLKNSKKKTDDTLDGTTIGHLARWANDWIYKKLADSSSAVRGQKLKEHLDRNAIKDDAILDCCLYFEQNYEALVILLSNDKNLCMKALANDIKTVSYRKKMSANLIAEKSFNENANGLQHGNTEPLMRASPSPPPPAFNHSYQETAEYIPPISNGNNQSEIQESDLSADYIETEEQEHYYNKGYTNDEETSEPSKHDPPASSNNSKSHLITIPDFFDASNLIHREVQLLVLSAIDDCMYEEYEDDVELVGYEKSNIKSLKDCSLVLIQFWISVFTEYFKTGHFKPFNMRGKKFTQFTDIPRSEQELDKFIKYWSNVLRGLYVKKNEAKNSDLEKLIERWEYISDHL
ncbi:hypothetical protein BN7_1435 [Wickerhamomyces ciferrii]|uniref:Transcriptional protein SWT1 n=1 Tax=Wickerhamomyces ciferrii (strain ATCC 14091 / BCRC 22168 / CBS 111 / JCM 3599 / NBRC 0793 / NRRL Y-1031 F-60-10) TaxID=1206466 RepID=K0KG30_WICCF|nr:uncharacterized protein BN7_1435 [Wickerhamomyces ciferrii]CCH41896.1 hypothetical protein BN7_1435 [Wickerhamomyces ciferrii]